MFKTNWFYCHRYFDFYAWKSYNWVIIAENLQFIWGINIHYFSDFLLKSLVVIEQKIWRARKIGPKENHII